ncbi:MAG: hypothetical protein IPF57_20255 [Gammaproteobacteria bacterium]|jgi:hypothetical protein|nr:hypothetical protein [Gammaproteobacteria bacterium]MBK8992169.1 hypothetical protein [Gammaproteobacteria bacterium]MBK9470397.1 hypothetical protein [Gammaproteobacteria bacterium]MBP6481036.1 hypothetical protein [Pseudomonadales bacterium]MBP7911474.1 hypothetical protein [Pseudomonadales bacterium]
MGEVIALRRPERHRGRTLCLNGHHKWKIWKEKQFDVRAGKLVTVYRCERCDARKVKAL